ncbi:BrnT family toxin [Pseudomonadota bacterium]
MLGQLNGRVVVIVYTNRDDNIRLISARKANSREQKIYNSKIK